MLLNKYTSNYETEKGVWDFEGYSVTEMSDDSFRFEDDEGNKLGSVVPGGPEDFEQYRKELNSGVDMIRQGTEDGAGNTLSIKGWWWLWVWHLITWYMKPWVIVM